MERLLQDVRFGARLLLKDRGFTFTTAVTLAICIGANAAVFAVVNSVLLRPLPYPGPDRLVHMFNSYPGAGVERASSGVPDYYDRLRETDAFEEIALYQTRGVTIGGEGEPQRVTVLAARPSLLRMLHARPLHGRIFTEDEGERGEDTRVVLGYALWQQLYAGDPAAVGRELRLNGVSHTIVGVLPDDFAFPSAQIRAWIPLSFTPEMKSDDARHNNSWTMIGRLKPGASVQQAQQQIDALTARNMERFPEFREILTNAGFRSYAVPYQEDLVREVSGTLYLLWGGALFVLLIGAVNITNLALIRSTGRLRELATRQALGAGISRLARQLLTETVMLTIAGGALGLLFGYWSLTVLAGTAFADLPRADEIRMDLAVAGFTLGVAVLVGALISLVPIARVRRMNLSQAFREEGRSGTSGRGSRAARRLLVASQVAFAFMLLVGAGLLFASFQRVLAVDPGFQPAGVLTARVAPPAVRYQGAAELRAFASRLLERVRAGAGVEAAGLTSNVPFGGDFSDSVILAEGYQMAPGESLISPYRVHVSPGYFETLRIPLLDGRTFAESDTESAPNVVIVDERLARRFWPGTSPVGRRMYRPDSPEDLVNPGPTAQWFTVVGVVGTTKMAGLVTTDDRPGTYYFPLAQQPTRSLVLAVRAQNPGALAPTVRRELAMLDPELPLYNVLTLEDRMGETLTSRRTPMLLALGFAAVALFLAAIGIYGVLAYQVSQRRREIGIRLALGSDARGIFGLVLREGLGLLAAGLAVGLAGAFAIRQAIAGQLYGVGPMDPLVLSAVGGVLAAVAFLACLVPARRAARVDPIVALAEQ